MGHFSGFLIPKSMMTDLGQNVKICHRPLFLIFAPKSMMTILAKTPKSVIGNFSCVLIPKSMMTDLGPNPRICHRPLFWIFDPKIDDDRSWPKPKTERVRPGSESPSNAAKRASRRVARHIEKKKEQHCPQEKKKRPHAHDTRASSHTGAEWAGGVTRERKNKSHNLTRLNKAHFSANTPAVVRAAAVAIQVT